MSSFNDLFRLLCIFEWTDLFDVVELICNFYYDKFCKWFPLDFLSLSFQLQVKPNAGSLKVVDVSFIFCSIYLLLGMALIAMCFNLMQVRFFTIHRISKEHAIEKSFLMFFCLHRRSFWRKPLELTNFLSSFSFQEQVIYKLTNLKKCASQCFKCKR